MQQYIRESVRCFVFGFFQGAVALASTSLETALRDAVPALPGRDLARLLESAWRVNLLPAELIEMAYEAIMRCCWTMNEIASAILIGAEILRLPMRCWAVAMRGHL